MLLLSVCLLLSFYHPTHPSAAVVQSCFMFIYRDSWSWSSSLWNNRSCVKWYDDWILILNRKRRRSKDTRRGRGGPKTTRLPHVHQEWPRALKDSVILLFERAEMTAATQRAASLLVLFDRQLCLLPFMPLWRERLRWKIQTTSLQMWKPIEMSPCRHAEIDFLLYIYSQWWDGRNGARLMESFYSLLLLLSEVSTPLLLVEATLQMQAARPAFFDLHLNLQ